MRLEGMKVRIISEKCKTIRVYISYSNENSLFS